MEMVSLCFLFNSLPDEKFLDWSKLKASADDKINVTEKIEISFLKIRKHFGKRKKMFVTNIFSYNHNV